MINTYKLKGKSFYEVHLSYTDKVGKRRQKKRRFNSKDQRIRTKYEASEVKFEALKTLKDQLSNKKVIKSFSDWHKSFLEQIRLTLKVSTIAQYDGDLKKWITKDFSSKDLKEISKSDIHNLIHCELVERKASPNIRNKVRKVLSRILECAVEEGLITNNPCKGIKVKVPPPKQEVFNHDEANFLLQSAKDVNHSFYYHWALALFTGMRNGELYALRWKDIDLVSDKIYVQSQWTSKDGHHSTKSNKNRIVPISKDLKKILLELKNEGTFTETFKALNKNDSVSFVDFVLPRSSQWKHGEQARILRCFCNEIQLKKVKFHDLRATFITNALSNGVTLPQIMAIVGHSRTGTTDKYLRLSGVFTQNATEKLSYSLPKSNSANVLNF